MNPNSENKGLERSNLIFFSIYYIGMIFITILQKWELWITFTLVLGILASMYIFAGQYKDFHFRTLMTSIAMLISFTLFSIHVENLLLILPVYIALLVLIGLYGNLDCIKVCIPFSGLIFFLHYIIIYPVWKNEDQSLFYGLLHLFNIIFVELWLFIWVKNRNKSTKQIAKSFEKQKKLEQSKYDFFSNVSHEIRTPINTICGMSEMLLKEDLSPTVIEAIQDIHNAGKALASVVNDIFAFTELHSNQMHIEEKIYQMTATLYDVIALSKDKINGKEIKLSYHIDDNLPCQLIGDEEKIKRVMMNFMDNAIKFTQKGSIKIDVTFEKRNEKIDLIVSVIDTGIGMKKEDMDKLFTSFNQAYTRTNRETGGIGLGLAIDHSIVTKMGGTITVKSKPKEGSIFKFTIPQKIQNETPIKLYKEEETTSTPSTLPDPFIAPDAHLLVVDDNIVNLKVIEGLLNGYQIQVTYALSGQEALEKIESKDYDFVFLDHMMPNMDGIETLQRIREKADPYFKNIPIIALSANATSEAKKMFKEEGFSDFVEKPIDLSILKRVLMQYLPASKLLSAPEDNIAPSETTTEEPLVIGDLDIATALKYCGTQEKFLRILKFTYECSKSTINQTEQLFQQQNWKDYTIAVHGIKSSMLNIGAVTLSNMAKQLEAAGKQEDYDTIINKHSEMVTEFHRIVELVRQYLAIPLEEEEEASDTSNLPTLSEEEFNNKIQTLEDIMFDLDEDKMMEILQELQTYQYHGVSLQSSLEPVVRKIKMSDYMSAVEMLKKIKKMIEETQ